MALGVGLVMARHVLCVQRAPERGEVRGRGAGRVAGRGAWACGMVYALFWGRCYYIAGQNERALYRIKALRTISSAFALIHLSYGTAQR